MVTPIPTDSSASVPPIVLLADDDPDTLEMYATYMEGEGLWVATASGIDEAVETIGDIKPDVVITDIGFSGRQSGVWLVHVLKQNPETAATPVVVVTAQSAEALPLETRREADLVLVKPVLPEVLLRQVRELFARSRDLRRRSAQALKRTGELMQKSAALLDHSREIQERVETTARSCPSCGTPLQWIERGSVGGVEYDYYRWCRHGCGLYCYERGARAGRNWVKLA